MKDPAKELIENLTKIQLVIEKEPEEFIHAATLDILSIKDSNPVVFHFAMTGISLIVCLLDKRINPIELMEKA